jgi:hypothetical protein
LEAVLTAHAMYLKLSAVSKQVGKPWVKLSFASLKKTSGVSLAPLLHQLQGSNPLADAELLSVSRDVHRTGSGTVNGVPATEYAGTLDLAQALARLDPQMRKNLGPALAAGAVGTVHFTAWIDGQHVIRRVAETETASGSHISTLVTITSINQPVHISVPPASKVARMPGL